MEKPVNNEKYVAILKTAHDLFWKFGFRRVTVEEVCREASVSKMTFYRFFSNKTDLVREVINDLVDHIYNDYQNLMAQDISFEEKVKKQLLMKFEGTNNISAELVKDIYGNHESEICKLWKSGIDKMLKIVLNDYADAQKRGDIRKDLKIEFIMIMTNKTFEIASDPEVQALYPDMQSLVMEIANMFFYGILPRENKK